MKTFLKTFGVAAFGTAAALSAPGMAQGGASPAPSACYIELRKLMAPSSGIADLGAAMRELDAKLRPQVEEVRRLRLLVAALEMEQQQAVLAASSHGEGEGTTSIRPVAMPVSVTEGSAAPSDLGRITLDLRRANEELEAKQVQLRTAYAEHMRAIVGPVQERIGQQALAYGSQRGCANLKMARTKDLGPLRSAGARDLTPEFVSWYAQARP